MPAATGRLQRLREQGLGLVEIAQRIAGAAQMHQAAHALIGRFGAGQGMAGGGGGGKACRRVASPRLGECCHAVAIGFEIAVADGADLFQHAPDIGQHAARRRRFRDRHRAGRS